MMRRRVAPSASRTPISCCRLAARASVRLATLAQAINNTSPTENGRFSELYRDFMALQFWP